LRAYALERLRAAGEWDEARRRHAEYFLGLLDLIDVASIDPPRGTWEWVEEEYEDVRAALTWALETGASMLALRRATPLWRFWASHSHYLEGLEWLERFIARAETPTTPEELSALADAWTGVLVFTHRLDRFERAREAGETALALRRQIGDRKHIAGAMMNLANPLTALRDFERATALYQECLAIHRAANYRRGMVFPLMNLGSLYNAMGRPREALVYYEESLAISREVGESDWTRGLTWNNVGEAYILLDEPARAVEAVEPSYELVTRQHDLFNTATCAFTLGRAQWRLGDAEAARAHLEEAERLFRTLGNPIMAARICYVRASLALEQGEVATARRDLAQALADLAGQARASEDVWWLVERAGTLACRNGEPERAARLYGAAIAHRDATPQPLDPAERDMRARDLDRLRAALGEGELADRLAEGQRLAVDDTVALVRQELEEPRR
jgi:tetratricopeptide (TPR) repeat protein